MKSYKGVLFLCMLIFSAAASVSGQEEKTYTIQGLVKGRNSTHIYLHKCTNDERRGMELIPIIDGGFEYTWRTKHVEAYTLIFKEEWEESAFQPVYFFNDQEIVKFTLHGSENFASNKIEGGDVNSSYIKLRRTYSSPALEQISRRSGVCWDSLIVQKDPVRKAYYKEMLEALNDESSSIMIDSTLARIGKEISLAGYFELHKMLSRYSKLIPPKLETFQHCYQIYSKKYPSHPYTEIISTLLTAQNSLHVGGNFIDFEASDIAGNPKRFSTLRQGKVTLLNLWGSWCRPCIVKSKALIPIYNQFKNKGFSVIGVAREFNDLSNFQIAMERDQYPWENMIELDDKNSIWLKYNIPFSGGSMILMDEKGKILAINPEIQDVEKLLLEKL